MTISNDALAMIRYLARLWVEKDFDTTLWFNRPEGDVTFPELRELGFIKLTGGSAQWSLTEGGRRWIMENRSALLADPADDEPTDKEPIGFRTE